MDLLNITLNGIQPVEKQVMSEAQNRIDNLTKPIGSLGTLEEIAIKVAGISGKLYNTINKKNIIIMCADNGVVEEGVSTCPQEVTAVVTNNFTKDITGVCTLARFNGADITIVDIGVKEDFENPKIINKKIRYGTANMIKGPAMKRDEAIRAIETGIEMVDSLVKEGYNLFGTGEMGIGNTSTSAAVLSVLSGLDSSLVVGKGSGLTEKLYLNKIQVVQKSIYINSPDKNDIIDVLSKVGGLDIAGLCGCYLGAAKNRVPIVIDGFIASVAALCAYRLNPLVRDYMFPSHLSEELGATYVMKELDFEPMLNLKMRLGEGSGCPLAFSIIEASLYAINNMATLEEAKIMKDAFAYTGKE
ncbi:MAG TPA: nicotinate-nucleotide--dimethylbenzimidazole phosphoribosyltransferase [Ruminiclostridium sp.]